MSKGESPKSGWVSFRPRRKQKLSRQSASRRPPNQNNKVSCERLARLVSLSLDVTFSGSSSESQEQLSKGGSMWILRLVRNFALLALLALAAHVAAGADKHVNPRH